MKKYFYYSLLLVLSFVFLSCGGDEDVYVGPTVFQDRVFQIYYKDIHVNYSYNGYRITKGDTQTFYKADDVIAYEVIDCSGGYNVTISHINLHGGKLWLTFLTDITDEKWNEIYDKSIQDDLLLTVTVRFELKADYQIYK